MLQSYPCGCFLPHSKGIQQLIQDGQLDVWDYYYRQNEVAFSHKVSDAPLTSIKISYQGSGNQITGGKLVAIGDQDGTVTLLELCESLYTLQKNERDIMGEIFNREMIKEKNLEAIRKLQELDKKKVPKDQTAARKKAEEKKAEMIKTAEDTFNEMLNKLKSEKPEEAEPNGSQPAEH